MDAQEIANEFKNFFVSVGVNLAKEIAQTHMVPTTLNINVNQNSMFLGAIVESDVLEVVSKLKNKRSTDCNNIDMSLIKQVIPCIVKPLTYIFNCSFATGTFPEKMKLAKVLPIYKSGDKHLVTNYRPVSLLDQFSKILEKLFVHQLDNFIEKHRILNDQQYGFRSSQSTSLAVMDFIENITTAVDKKESAIGIFIDLRKAFDTINHDILIQKCEYYGIRGVVNKWLQSYLKNRFQYVQFNGTVSSQKVISCGIPQGSVLGPKLFILYLKDISKVSKILKMVIFAEDTNLFCTGPDLNQLVTRVELELNNLKTWFDQNKLSLNDKKTKFMIFGPNEKNFSVKIVFKRN